MEIRCRPAAPTTAMDAYLVIGNPNTRKASLLRSLSGCYQRSVRDIQPLGGQPVLRLYARAGALQHTRTTPSDFIADVERVRCNALLCCLAPEADPDHLELLPAAPDYVAAFEAAGQNGGGVRSARLHQFAQAPVAPINHTARLVRAHFGWE